MAVLMSIAGIYGTQDPALWSNKKIDRWFERKEFIKGWNVRPDKSINRRAFAVSYFRNRERWDKAFNFLMSNDFTNMELKRYDIDSNNLYATVSEYLSKDPSTVSYEAHQKYIDIQYVASGEELIGIAPLVKMTGIVSPYDPAKDIEFLNISGGIDYKADPGRFFIFFPEDAHRPGLRDGDKATVRKVVVKLKVD